MSKKITLQVAIERAIDRGVSTKFDLDECYLERRSTPSQTLPYLCNMICLNCGTSKDMRVNEIKECRLPICLGCERRTIDQSFLDRLSEKRPDLDFSKAILVTRGSRNWTHISNVICRNCGKIFDPSRHSSFEKTSACQVCANLYIPLESIENTLQETYSSKFDPGIIQVTSRKTNSGYSKRRVHINCLLCKSVIRCDLDVFMNGNAICRKCNPCSLLEQKVIDELDKRHIIYEKEKRFSDCVHKKPLKFDFFLNEHDWLIEADGAQHFYPVKSWGGEKTFREIQLRDKIKNDWVKTTKYNLLRIRFDEVDVISDKIDYILDIQHG